jgi:hypothetical protein
MGHICDILHMASERGHLIVLMHDASNHGHSTYVITLLDYGADGETLFNIATNEIKTLIENYFDIPIKEALD